MSQPRVIHTAQALVDEVVEIAALPERGGNAMASSYHRYAGGAVTILLAAARNGAAAVHAGSVGTGANGDLIRSVLAAERIALSSPAVPDVDTGICVVMVEPSAERTFVTTRGAERQITPASLGTSAPVAGDLVCVSGYTLLDPTRKPLQEWLIGLPRGVEVVLDPGDVFASLPAEVVEAILARTTVWTSNTDEATALTGETDWAASARAVASRLPADAVVVVRDGERGCVVLVAGELTEVAGFPQRAVDTNGAGDTHTGVLLASRARGVEWVAACRRANAGGAIKVTRKGPTTAPTSAEIDAFLAAADAG
ncbi:sugar kinase [Calidifontibacter sp. DB0510]|uniref:Sugar kinase n=1 Tax=Metallococcus carri TaxID=1656884 RepID=A0A967B3B0_9MICO|nr:PfkB family carbohydrate kinase [Metallococcus carri]NHN56758.1 sugar kinase [Metallococcus carri]NOP37865.1 sugar kinase [Calidifontibacter sp. DB2511S]